VGRRLYRAAEGPRRAGSGRRAGGGGARAMAGLGLEFEPGLRSGTSPTGGSRLAAREKKGRRELGAGWAVGPGKGRSGAGCWARPHGREKKRKGQLGRSLRDKKGEREKERESEPGPKRKRGRKRNAFQCI
jgi:hypothetical protein